MESGAVCGIALKEQSPKPQRSRRKAFGLERFDSARSGFLEARRILLKKQRDERAIEANSRRGFLQSSLMGGFAASLYPALGAARVVAPETRPAEVKDFELDEITIDQLQAGMKSGKYTARSITQTYLERIQNVDKQGPKVNSILELNPDALEIAESLDRERKEKGARGPLHGVPL